MSRDAMALARENEQLRAEVLRLQQGREMDPQEHVAMVAKALMDRDSALRLAMRVTSVLLARAKDAIPVIRGDGTWEFSADCTAKDFATADGGQLRLEALPDGGQRVTLVLRAPPAAIGDPS